MKITSERIPASQVVLQIELEEPEIEQHKQRAYRKLVQRYVVPGFRKGKAPRGILERYLGDDALVQEDLEDLLERTVMEAVEQEKLEAVARPEITEVASLAPVTFKATVPLKPEVDLGDYKSVRVPWEPPVVGEEEVQQVLENIRRQSTPWEPAERPAQLGDLLTLDVTGYVEETPEASASEESNESSADASPEDGRRVFIEEEGISYLAQEEVTYPVPGFAQELVGMAVDETREFIVHAPDDFTVRDLNGKDCHFTVTLHEVKEQRPPEMDDEWAKGVMEGYDSLEALRESIASDLRERADAQAHAEYEEKVLDALTGVATIEYPPIMVESEIDHLLQDQDERLRGMGLSLSTYLASSGQDVDALRESVRSEAERRVLRALLVSRIAETDGIEVSSEETDAEVDRVVESQPEGEARDNARQLFASEAARDTVQRRLVARKVVEYITAIARDGSAGDVSEADSEERTEETEGAPEQHAQDDERVE